MLLEHTIEFRVRYQETDAQGIAHHANYLIWMEMARVELVRASGRDYRQVEEDGLFFVLSQAAVRYLAPARFDDLVRLTVHVRKAKGARILHAYQFRLGESLLATAESTIACCSKATGGVTRIPDWMVHEPPETHANPRR